MKRLLCIIASLAAIVSCGNNNQKRAAETQESGLRENCVEVLVFYGTQRCATCRAIESQSKELAENTFAEDLASGLLVYRTVDMTTADGEALADRYEVASSSLLLVQHLGDKETVNNLTRFAFGSARTKPEEFKDGLQKAVRDLLNVTPPEACCTIEEP